jgi:hypothetical protein
VDDPRDEILRTLAAGLRLDPELKVGEIVLPTLAVTVMDILERI